MTFKDKLKQMKDSIDTFLEETEIVEKGKKKIAEAKDKVVETYNSETVQSAISTGKQVVDKAIKKAEKTYNSIPVQVAKGAVIGAAGSLAEKVVSKYEEVHEKLEKSAETGDDLAKKALKVEEVSKRAYSKAENLYSIVKKAVTNEKYTALIPGFEDIMTIAEKESSNSTSKAYTKNIEGNVNIGLSKFMGNSKVMQITATDSDETSVSSFSLNVVEGYKFPELKKVVKGIAKDLYDMAKEDDTAGMDSYHATRKLTIALDNQKSKDYLVHTDFSDGKTEIAYNPTDIDGPLITISYIKKTQ